mgnify:CR=1 FL=1
MSPDGTPVFTSRRASALEPYTPGEQPQDRSYIKLNTNENPYPPAPAVQEYLSSVDAERLRLYPDPESNEKPALELFPELSELNAGKDSEQDEQ